ncbi:MAG: hypothetical protein PVH46_00980 [Granulosicoccaceae bacterium]|jgi:hypothetical protein
MTISADLLATIVSVALLITIIAPVTLVLLWIKDWKNGKLW